MEHAESCAREVAESMTTFESRERSDGFMIRWPVQIKFVADLGVKKS